MRSALSAKASSELDKSISTSMPKAESNISSNSGASQGATLAQNSAASGRSRGPDPTIIAAPMVGAALYGVQLGLRESSTIWPCKCLVRPTNRSTRANPHRQFHVLADGERHVALRRRADAGEIVGAPIGVVGDEERAGLEARFEQRQNFRIKSLRAVHQHQVDRVGQVARKRLDGVAVAHLDQVGEAGLGEGGARPRDLRRLELGGDEAAAAIVAQRRAKIERRDAERGAELDDV